MTTEVLTMLGLTVTILVANWTMIRSLRADLKADIKDVRSEIKTLDGKLETLRADVSNLSERMATLEGAMSALRDVIAGRAVA